jgi:hypothetical protein
MSNVEEVSVAKANEMWNDLKQRIKDDPEFVNKPDSEKVELYQKSGFKEFYTAYPIVCRYMLCMGQFSTKAFKRYLAKCISMSSVPRTKDYDKEAEWIKRQADYVRYLWESYQKQHFNKSDSNAIWQNAYATLSKEMTDFKNLQKEIEAKMATSAKNNKTTMVKELLARLSNEEQSLDEKTTKELISKLEDKLINQRRKNVMNQINNDVPTITPSRQFRGSRE